MKRTYIIIIIGVTLAFVALFSVLYPFFRKDVGMSEAEQGTIMLNEARQLYSEGRYAAARDTILSLRKNYPTALEARRQAILLMDSIELQLAEGDSLKQEFFRRKLEHDCRNFHEGQR